MLQWLGKILIFLGILLTLLGLIFYFSPSFSQIPVLKYLGRLPGDISVRKENFSFYFPLTSSILISIILTILLYLFNHWRR